MVVSRKKPSAPAPPNSRTSSTQALPRAGVTKPTHPNLSTPSDNISIQSSKHAPNGSLKKFKGKPGSRPSRPQRRKRSLLDRLFFFFLATTAIYALYTCPSDINHTSPVCRSLAIYRTHVLEPFVIPPIRAAITHPAVVQPYEKYARPVYQKYVLPATPYVAAAQRRAAPYANTIIRFSKRTTLLVWNSAIKPYWTRAIVPRYNIYIQPHVNKYISPITRRVKYYNRRAEPYVQALAHHTSVYSRQTQRYALATYTKLKPHVIRAYNVTHIYMSRAYNQVKPLFCRASKEVRVKGKYLLGKALASSQIVTGRAGDLRKQYVDPHVLKIWEKAAEKSGASPNRETSTTIATASTGSTSFQHIPDVDADLPGATAGTMEQATTVTPSASIVPTPSPFTAPEVIAQSTEKQGVPDAPPIPTSSPISDKVLEKTTAAAEDNDAHASNINEKVQLNDVEYAPVNTLEPIEVPEEVQGAKSAASVIQASLHPGDVDATGTGEVENFLRDLGLDKDEEGVEPVEPEPEVQPVEEEDEEVKKAAVAAKRAEIVGRHVRWQSELDALAKDLEGRVVDEIRDTRADAIRHIGSLPSDKSGTGSDGKGKEVIAKVQIEGEKLLKGLEGYVKKLGSRKFAEEELEKEKEIWNKVADKVEKKFQDVVTDIQEEVHGWYLGIREKESSVVLSASQQVKSLADRAQADLGLDYAWLDDVTYYDWQKYHDLMRTFERFEQTARALQNGTHSDAPEDELVPILNNLDHEVQEMITGFAFKLGSLIREGDKWLSGYSEPEPDNEPESEEHGASEGEHKEEESPVSILPISSDPAQEYIDPANIIIGKSKEQIEQAVKQAAADRRDEL